MRLSIRWQLALVSVALSLLPIALAGILAYRSARGALEERIQFNLETLASLSAEKLQRLLLDRHQALRGWSQLGFLQDDTVTGDTDGRIQQFLGEAKRNFDLYQEIWVANAAGTVIASTRPELRGREIGDREWQQAARRGDPWAGLPGPQELTGRVGMPLAFPIRASFDRGRTVGVIVAVLDWPSVVEILNGVKVVPEGQSERGYLILADSSGVLLSAPSFFTGWQPGKTGLNSLGLEAIQQLPASAAAGNATFDVRDASYLAGYATTERQPYVPGTWRTVLLMRADVAFAPLRRLMWTIIVLSIVLATAAAARLGVLGESVLAPDRIARAVSPRRRRRRSLAGLRSWTATTSWACSPRPPTTCPGSCAGSFRSCRTRGSRSRRRPRRCCRPPKITRRARSSRPPRSPRSPRRWRS